MGDRYIEPETSDLIDARAEEVLAGSEVLPVNYSPVLGDNRLIFAADHHLNWNIREHILKYARSLKDAGITHFAIEIENTKQKLLDDLSEGRDVDISGSGLDPKYVEALREVAKHGIKLVAIDVPHTFETILSENRENGLFDNTKSILSSNTSNKVFVLIGTFHVVTEFNPSGIRSMRGRFVDSGVSVPSVFFYEGVGGSAKLDRMVKEQDLADKDFMLDHRSEQDRIAIPFDNDADWIIHLPT